METPCRRAHAQALASGSTARAASLAGNWAAAAASDDGEAASDVRSLRWAPEESPPSSMAAPPAGPAPQPAAPGCALLAALHGPASVSVFALAAQHAYGKPGGAPGLGPGGQLTRLLSFSALQGGATGAGGKHTATSLAWLGRSHMAVSLSDGSIQLWRLSPPDAGGSASAEGPGVATASAPWSPGEAGLGGAAVRVRVLAAGTPHSHTDAVTALAAVELPAALVPERPVGATASPAGSEPATPSRAAVLQPAARSWLLFSGSRDQSVRCCRLDEAQLLAWAADAAEAASGAAVAGEGGAEAATDVLSTRGMADAAQETGGQGRPQPAASVAPADMGSVPGPASSGQSTGAGQPGVHAGQQPAVPVAPPRLAVAPDAEGDGAGPSLSAEAAAAAPTDPAASAPPPSERLLELTPLNRVRRARRPDPARARPLVSPSGGAARAAPCDPGEATLQLASLLYPLPDGDVAVAAGPREGEEAATVVEEWLAAGCGPSPQTPLPPELRFVERLWDGDVAGAVALAARTEGMLTADVVALSACGGYELWAATARLYAAGMEAAGCVPEAALALVSLGDRDVAAGVYQRAGRSWEAEQVLVGAAEGSVVAGADVAGEAPTGAFGGPRRAQDGQ